MDDGHMKTVEEALSFFHCDQERGLTLDQVKTNQAKYGPNGKLIYPHKHEFAKFHSIL